jgi:acyl transferase domain-containing protein
LLLEISWEATEHAGIAPSPIEFIRLTTVYGTDGTPGGLGSAKSNVGHTEAAAGAVGIIKAMLSPQHGVVPPNLHSQSS